MFNDQCTIGGHREHGTKGTQIRPRRSAGGVLY